MTGFLLGACLQRDAKMFVSLYFTTRAEVEQFVVEYVDFYNFERITLKRGLIPVETRSKTA